MTRLPAMLLALLLAAAPATLHAQQRDNGLSNKEIDQLRDSAQFPDERIRVFIGFLNDRIQSIDDLFSRPRRPGREQDVHDLMQQVNDIAGEMEDNLLDYKSHHDDLRKVLPRLLAATEHWTTQLKAPADDSRYNIVRKLAVDAVNDIHEDAAAMVPEQKAWFAAHPPQKKQPDNRPPEPYVLPDPDVR